jgi:ketosteroid isomerase-like protein
MMRKLLMMSAFVPLAATAADPADALIKAEQAFSKRSAEVGFITAMDEVLADEAVVLENNSRPIVGKAAVLKAHAAGWPPAEAKPVLTWEPLAATISAGGDLGFTYGLYAFASVAKDGTPRTARGSYTTIWKKQNGAWKVLLDTGTQGLEPPPKP